MMKQILLIATGVFLLQTAPLKAQNTLYSDFKANQVGDIITVVLQENISGRSNADSKTASNADGSASAAAAGNFLPFQPTFGSDVSVNYDSGERIQSSQGQLLQGIMSVQVIDVSPRGDLIIEGTRLTQINGKSHQMKLTGSVRPVDVNSQNQVMSYRIANANIMYDQQVSRSKIGRKIGPTKKVIFTGLGVLLGAAILMN